MADYLNTNIVYFYCNLFLINFFKKMSLSLSVCLVKKLLLTLELGVVKKQTIIKLLKFQIVILKNNNSKKIYI